MFFPLHQRDFIFPIQNDQRTLIVGSDGSLNRSEFALEVKRFSERLLALNLPKGHPVMIYGHKEKHYPVAICALMQLGLPYVPSDIIFPFSRICAMQEVCSSRVLIALRPQKELEEQFDVVLRFPEGNDLLKAEVNTLPNYPADTDDEVSYILFTSGSTGIPKGVPIMKTGVDAFGSWIASDFGLLPDDVILNVSALSFDFASFELYAMLELGCTLLLTDASLIKTPDHFLVYLQEHQVTTWVSTPGLVFLYLMDPRFNSQHLPHIKRFVFAGEALPLRTVKKLHELFPGAVIINAYGPTEATNLTAKCELSPELIDQYQAVPIGYAKPDSTLLIDQPNENGQGELLICGQHVSPGYLNQAEQSSERFFKLDQQRVYRSGDLVWEKDGLFFYAGRTDDVVKWHGYRIDPEDISSQLKTIQGVKNAACIPLKTGQETKRLVAFVVSELEQDFILTELAKRLPEYMLPSDIRFLDEIPLNASDKVDKKKLLELFMAR